MGLSTITSASVKPNASKVPRSQAPFIDSIMDTSPANFQFFGLDSQTSIDQIREEKRLLDQQTRSNFDTTISIYSNHRRVISIGFVKHMEFGILATTKSKPSGASKSSSKYATKSSLAMLASRLKPPVSSKQTSAAKSSRTTASRPKKQDKSTIASAQEEATLTTVKAHEDTFWRSKDPSKSSIEATLLSLPAFESTLPNITDHYALKTPIESLIAAKAIQYPGVRYTGCLDSDFDVMEKVKTLRRKASSCVSRRR